MGPTFPKVPWARLKQEALWRPRLRRFLADPARIKGYELSIRNEDGFVFAHIYPCLGRHVGYMLGCVKPANDDADFWAAYSRYFYKNGKERRRAKEKARVATDIL